MFRQPLENQTLYAELLEQLQARERLRSIGALEGSFVNKTVKGEKYVYFQYYDPGGRKHQAYVGKRTAAMEAVLDVYRAERASFAHEQATMQRLCAQLRAGGALPTDHASARVLRQLAERGVFRLGGVLVGTHAFAVLGNVLGVRWEHGATRTRDIDIAADRKGSETGLAVAIPEISADVPGTLESLQMGFFPIPQLDHRRPSTSFMIRGNRLRVDVLTPALKHQADPVFIPRFKVAAQPLRFLDYLIEEPIQAAVVDGGGILVNAPSPARYAVHKLFVAQERSAEVHAKREKDLFQSFQLLSLLKEERPGDVQLALDLARSRGEGWKRRVEAGLDELGRKYGLAL
jgi:hypothetical protein